MSTYMLWIIIAMAAATFPSRFLPMVLLRSVRINETIKSALQIMPFCIMVSLLTTELSADGDIATYKLIALVPVFVICYATENVGLGVLSGVAAYSTVWYFGI